MAAQARKIKRGKEQIQACLNRDSLKNKCYDAIVVGAGPAGSYIAYELSALNYEVAVLEQKEAPGIGVCCTGIISPECLDSFSIGQDAILTKVHSAKFLSPSGKLLRLSTDAVQAYVVDRSSFDLAIAEKAQAKGACYLFSSRVTDVVVEKDYVRVEVIEEGSQKSLAARAAVVATGFKPKLLQNLGLGRIDSFAIGAQMEVETKNVDEIEVYFNRDIAPGFFAWLVPTARNKALVGLISSSYAHLYLKRLLLSPFCQGKITKEGKLRQKLIPLKTLPRTYRDRVLVIGDAAGQVKPTTGGGIYFGHLGAEIGARVLSEALRVNDLSARFLSRYAKQWKAKIGRELFLGRQAWRLYQRLKNQQIERIFNIISSDGIAESLLRSPDFSFDWHSKLILAALGHSFKHKILSFTKLRY